MIKNLKISEKLHKKIKIHCANNNLKINEWVELELNKILKDDNNQDNKE
jgi:predicted HicB family RNase H-like nuclease